MQFHGALQHTDSGRSSDGYSNEKGDCTVRAYATAAEIPYKIAHAEMFLAGRKIGRGFNCVPFFIHKYGEMMPRPKMTVQKFVNTFCLTGNWIVLVRGHVFAVINGTIHDEYPRLVLNMHVHGAWRVK